MLGRLLNGQQKTGPERRATPFDAARRFVLDGDADRSIYFKLLRESVVLYRVSLIGYCLMSNHIHLIVRDQLTNFAVEIKNTTGAVRDAYRKVQEQASTPEALLIELRTNKTIATKDSDGEPLPVFDGHIYSDAAGKFPAKLNDWESKIVTTEIARRSFVAWYRNPQRSTANSLRIPYQNESDQWSSLQVDFLIISKRDDGTLVASIVDPHGDHLADAKSKLRALADFAEAYGHQFLRIQSRKSQMEPCESWIYST